MSHTSDRKTWQQLMDSGELQLLPTAHDALAARLIEKAGYTSYQIGMFAVVGARYGYPDIDLAQFGENSQAVRDIISASDLPVLVDCDDAYGDVKNAVHVANRYHDLGASAVFIEDQASPKRCGHMAGKRVVPAEILEDKLKAVTAYKADDLFVIARTDSREQFGLDEALRRGERYLKAGANGLFIEALHDEKEVEKVAREFAGTPLAVNMFEGGGKTPLMPPQRLHELGYSMVFLPTSLILTVAKAITDALEDLKQGTYPVQERGVDFTTYESAMRLPFWAKIEQDYLQHDEKIEITGGQDARFTGKEAGN